MSVDDRTFPPGISFKKIVVACPTLRLLALAPTDIPINGACKLWTGFKNIFHVLSVSSKSFFRFCPNSFAF